MLHLGSVLYISCPGFFQKHWKTAKNLDELGIFAKKTIWVYYQGR